MADTIKTNLGPVTAYADAKAHGYTGTREEFGVLLANAGLNLKAAETAKADAEAAKQAAETAQQAAASSASSASTSASTATAQAAAAKFSADAAKASEAATEKSAQGAAASESAAKAAQTAAETAKANADTAASNAAAKATAAANSAADAKKTLESIPADYSKLSGKVNDNTSWISELKGDLANFQDGKINVFTDESVWSIGSLGTDGKTLIPSLNYRVSCNTPIYFGEKTKIYIPNGYRIYSYFFDEDDAKKSSISWTTDILTIKENSICRFVVAKVDETKTYIMDVSEVKLFLTDGGLVHDVKVLQDSVFEIPAYCKAEAVQCLERINAISYEMDNPEVFMFTTDAHLSKNRSGWNTVYYGLKAVAEYVCNKIPLTFICIGGDEPFGSATKEGDISAIMADIRRCREPFGRNVISIVGNHDGWQNNENMTDEKEYFAKFKEPELDKKIVKHSLGATNGYLDSVQNKVRYIFCDTKNVTNLRNAISDMIGSMPEGYKAIILSHHALNTNLSGSAFVGAINCNDVLTNNADKIICCVNGHSHKDGYENADGNLHIAVTTSACTGLGSDGNTVTGYTIDAVSYDDYYHTVGTADETSIDFFIVDTKNNVIKTVRYGAGNDREFSY